jgi:hypothetical protein
MRAQNWLLVFALALAIPGGDALGQSSDLPPCPGGDDARADLPRDNCQAKVRFASGVYIGEFHANRRDGKGVWLYPNGAKYAGDFRNGKPSGQGTYTYPNGSRYVGDFRDGKFNGAGVLYGADGARMSAGLFADDKYVGAAAPTPAQAPAADAQSPPPPLGPRSIRLTPAGNQNMVAITLNGVVTLDAFIDSGADTLVIPADAFAKLEAYRTIAPEDYLGTATVVLASGAQSEGRVVRIRSLKVGEVKVGDVIAVVGTKQAPTLLGQSFLRKFRSWSIDNRRHTLNLE